MRIESVFPFSYLHELLVTVLVFVVGIWPGGVVDVIPVLQDLHVLVLLALLSSTTLALLGSMEAIHVLVVRDSGPVG